MKISVTGLLSSTAHVCLSLSGMSMGNVERVFFRFLIFSYTMCSSTCGGCDAGKKEGTPWRIGTLKYLEIKIEEWPSRAKWGQSGPNGAKWCQMMPNRVKRGKTGSNGAKRGQKEPYGAKLGQKGQTGQTRPNGVKWG